MRNKKNLVKKRRTRDLEKLEELVTRRTKGAEKTRKIRNI
jgi:hypothetical protein